MRPLGWVIIIGLVIYMYAQYDPDGYAEQKQKLLDSTKDIGLKKLNESINKNSSIITEQNFSGVQDGNFVEDVNNWGRPKKFVEFLCTSNEDCLTYFPDAPSTVQCHVASGECISP